MNLTYSPTIKDFRAGLRLHYRQKLTRRIKHFLDFWILPLLVLILSAPTVYKMLTQPDEYSGAFGWLIIALAFSLIVPLRQYYGVNRQFKCLFPDLQTNREVSIEFNDNRVISAIPGIGEGTYYWNAILNYAQDEKITLLYLAKNRFLFIPTQAFTPAQRIELNDLVARHVVKKKS
jgi:hypothetical protein